MIESTRERFFPGFFGSGRVITCDGITTGLPDRILQAHLYKVQPSKIDYAKQQEKKERRHDRKLDQRLGASRAQPIYYFGMLHCFRILQLCLPRSAAGLYG